MRLLDWKLIERIRNIKTSVSKRVNQVFSSAFTSTVTLQEQCVYRAFQKYKELSKFWSVTRIQRVRMFAKVCIKRIRMCVRIALVSASRLNFFHTVKTLL